MTAISIYQGILDRVSRAVMEGDLAPYLSCISLPYVIRTHGGVFTLTHFEEMQAMLMTLHDDFQRRGVTDYVRIARWATYKSPRHIEGMHFTHILRNGERITAPHAGSHSLILADDRWRVTESRYAVDNTTLPIRFPDCGENGDSLPQQELPTLVRA